MLQQVIENSEDAPDIEDSYPLSYYAIDAVLVLAQAVSDTQAGWNNLSFCETESARSMSSVQRCMVRQKLLDVNIQGLTVG